MPDDRIKVLVADDDAVFVESLCELIDRQPELEVVGSAANGLEVIDLANTLDADAVVVDLHMPLLDGIAAVRRLRRDHPHLCLIVLTGDADRRRHRAAEKSGADAVLEKRDFAQGLIDRLAAESARRPSSA